MPTEINYVGQVFPDRRVRDVQSDHSETRSSRPKAKMGPFEPGALSKAELGDLKPSKPEAKKEMT